MSMPFYVSPEQVMQDKAEYARKGIGRGKSSVTLEYDAGILYKQGIHPKPRNFVLQPLREFRRRFFTLRGYRDGAHGLRLSGLMAYYNFDVYRRLARMWRESGGY